MPVYWSASPVPVTNSPVIVSVLPRSVASLAGMIRQQEIEGHRPAQKANGRPRQGGVGIDLERPLHRRNRQGSRERGGPAAARGRDPLPVVEDQSQARLAVGYHQIPLRRTERPRRQVDVQQVGFERMAQTNLRRPIEQLIGQPQKASGRPKEVILPPEQVVGLAGQHVDDGVLNGHVGVPHAKCSVVEVDGLGGGGVPGRLPRRSAPAVDAGQVAEQIELQQPAGLDAAVGRRLARNPNRLLRTVNWVREFWFACVVTCATTPLFNPSLKLRVESWIASISANP